MFSLDPLRLDRDIAEIARRHRRFLTELRRSDATDHAFELLPRGVDGELLETLASQEAQDPLARPARRWLGYLLVEYGRLEQTRAVAHALFRERHGIHRPEPGQYSLAELRARALSDPLRADQWMEVFAERADGLAARRSESSEARAELCARMAPWELASDARVQRAEQLARRLIDATKEPYSELGVTHFGALFQAALGALVPGNWPAPLNARTLSGLLAEGGWFDGLNPEPFEAPAALGAASVLRGLFGVGCALHDAGAPRKQPFVLAREPSGLRRLTYGSLFSSMPSRAPFAERRLAVGRPRLGDYLRQLARVVLVGVRQAALRVLLHAGLPKAAAVNRGRFVESAELALGFETAGELSGALFWSERAVATFEALLLAAARDTELTEEHDEDWFRNPRAARELRAELEAAPAESAETAALEAGLSALSSRLLSAL